MTGFFQLFNVQIDKSSVSRASVRPLFSSNWYRTAPLPSRRIDTAQPGTTYPALARWPFSTIPLRCLREDLLGQDVPFADRGQAPHRPDAVGKRLEHLIFEKNESNRFRFSGSLRNDFELGSVQTSRLVSSASRCTGYFH